LILVCMCTSVNGLSLSLLMFFLLLMLFLCFYCCFNVFHLLWWLLNLNNWCKVHVILIFIIFYVLMYNWCSSLHCAFGTVYGNRMPQFRYTPHAKRIFNKLGKNWKEEFWATFCESYEQPRSKWPLTGNNRTPCRKMSAVFVLSLVLPGVETL